MSLLAAVISQTHHTHCCHIYATADAPALKPLPCFIAVVLSSLRVLDAVAGVTAGLLYRKDSSDV